LIAEESAVQHKTGAIMMGASLAIEGSYFHITIFVVLIITGSVWWSLKLFQLAKWITVNVWKATK
jgi:hypothetical protein